MKKRTNKKSTLSKRVKTKSSSIAKAADQDIIGLLTVLVQKLTSFEAKLDMVLSRIPPQPITVPKPQPVIVPSPKQGRDNRPMHKAVCADCRRDCEVPFKPREDRQVYCKECFTKRKNNKSIFKPRESDKPKETVPVNTAPAVKPKAVKPAKAPKKSPPKKKPAVKKKKTSRK
ncbi:MAG: CxxC-x17-CxxC domain-containing protein [Candidatus Omnitrophota bacterium]